ncbi:hypothetical protein JaAD80_27720 [Janthinobacterium sp. AD80]|nr:hypothetical protein JaAD80_27720 [Janthinobacterium sp. AD80]
MAGDDDGLLRGQRARCISGRGARHAVVHQAGVGQLRTVIDFQVQLARRLAAHAAHQVAHTEGREDPGAQRRAALRHAGARQAIVIHGQDHQETIGIAAAAVLHQADLARHGGLPRIARLLQRGAAHGLGQDIVAKRQRIALVQRFQVGDRCMPRALPRRTDGIAGIAFRAHLRFVLRTRRAGQQRQIADAVDAGEMPVDLLRRQVGAKFAARDILRTGIQALHAMQHLDVGLHAADYTVEQFADTEIKIGAHLLHAGIVHIAPGAIRQPQAQRQHQHGKQAWPHPVRDGPGKP